MRSSKQRSRSKPNRNRSVGNIVNRVFDSSGPEGKVRGTPQQIIDKYNQLTRDAQLSNDRVAAENFQQHAEHYTRMLGDAMREAETRRDPNEGVTNGQNGHGGQQNGQNGQNGGGTGNDRVRDDTRQDRSRDDRSERSDRVSQRDDSQRVASRDDSQRVAGRDDQPRVPSRDDDARRPSRDDDARVPSRDDDARVPSRDDDSRNAPQDDRARRQSRDDHARVPSRDDDSRGAPRDDRSGRDLYETDDPARGTPSGPDARDTLRTEDPRDSRRAGDARDDGMPAQNAAAVSRDPGHEDAGSTVSRSRRRAPRRDDPPSDVLGSSDEAESESGLVDTPEGKADRPRRTDVADAPQPAARKPRVARKPRAPRAAKPAETGTDAPPEAAGNAGDDTRSTPETASPVTVPDRAAE